MTRLRMQFVAVILTTAFWGNWMPAQAPSPKSMSPEFGQQSSLMAIGLPRLLGTNNEILSLSPSAYRVVDLTEPAAGSDIESRFVRRAGLGFLALEPGTSWSHQLRPLHKRCLYVTFTMHASIGTIVTLNGARLQIASSRRPTHAGISVPNASNGSTDPLDLRLYTPLRPFDGRLMATYGALTIKLNEAQTWDLFVGYQHLATDLPLSMPPDSEPQFKIVSGAQGAWLCGLVIADANPLYVDDNHNNVDDAFEHNHLGQLLPPSAHTTARAALQAAWGEQQRSEPPPPLRLRLPPADKTPRPQ